MDKATIINQEKENVLGVYSRPEFVIERGEGCTLYDSDGKAYLDCVSGIAVNSLGYNAIPVLPTRCISVSAGLMPTKARSNLLVATLITRATKRNIIFSPLAMPFMGGSLVALLRPLDPNIRKPSSRSCLVFALPSLTI